MTTISKAILSGTTPEQASEQAAGLASAPLRTPEATDPRQLAPPWTLPLATPADLHDAASLIRALIRNAATA